MEAANHVCGMVMHREANVAAFDGYVPDDAGLQGCGNLPRARRCGVFAADATPLRADPLARLELAERTRSIRFGGFNQRGSLDGSWRTPSLLLGWHAYAVVAVNHSQQNQHQHENSQAPRAPRVHPYHPPWFEGTTGLS